MSFQFGKFKLSKYRKNWAKKKEYAVSTLFFYYIPPTD